MWVAGFGVHGLQGLGGQDLWLWGTGFLDFKSFWHAGTRAGKPTRRGNWDIFLSQGCRDVTGSIQGSCFPGQDLPLKRQLHVVLVEP